MSTSEPGPAHPAPVEVVLLLHGMGRTSLSMRGMCRHLAANGFRPIDWPYASLRGTIDAHAARLTQHLRDLDRDPGVARIHAVTHSLGGIITRKALLDNVPAKMGRVVMLAPPNHGSLKARRLAPVFGRWVKPLADLSNSADSAVNRMGTPAGVEIGVIAAARDGKVRIADTHLAGEADHLVVAGFHTFVMNSRAARTATVRFLRSGRFREPVATPPADAAVE